MFSFLPWQFCSLPLCSASSFLVWPANSVFVSASFSWQVFFPQKTFTLSGGGCEEVRARRKCKSKWSSHLSAQAANSWWKRCKMAEQRRTRWKMTGNRFPFLSSSLAWEEADHQSAVVSGFQMLALLSYLLTFILPSPFPSSFCNALVTGFFCWLFCSLICPF